MTHGPSGAERAAELDHLRARLAEAEEALSAIRNGDVDAVVVTGGRGEQVYTLSGADRVYRQLIEAMGEGAATVSADGVILYCNPRVAEMLGRPLDQVVGTALRNYLPPQDQQTLDALLADARTAPSRRELTLITGEGRLVPVQLSASRLQSEGGEMLLCLVLTDLTGQRSHEHIAAAERLARLILEQAAEAIVVCDELGRVVRASRAAQRLCGGGPSTGPFAEAFPLRADGADPFHLAPILLGETRRNVDVALDRQGQTLDLILNAGPLLSGQQIVGCVVTLTDITERKRAETARRESEARYRTLFQQFPDGILILDIHTHMPIMFNDVVARQLGYSREEFARLRVNDYEATESPAETSARMETVLREGRVQFETEHRTKTGDVRSVMVTAQTVTLSGQPALNCIFRDITDRKRAEESHTRLATAVEQSAETMFICDAQGTILYVNPAFEKTTGYSREDAIGQNPRLLKSGAQDAEFYRQMWTALARGDVWRDHIINKRKDGTLVEVDASISPVRDAAGQVVNYVAVERDITNETRLEQQLFQAQKMEAVGRLAGGVAHDFNNLLTVITGYSEIVYMQLAGEDPNKRKVEQVLKAAQRGAGLTRQLLAFSRKQILQPKILDINTVVSDVSKMLRQVIGEDIELATLPEAHLGCVRVDPGQIEQVLMNLVVNARDAMPEGGRITIETRNAHVDADYAATHPPIQPGPYAVLVVTDTGSGMDAATQAQIFEPFFTSKEMGKGTGLGLATVYGIIKQSEGYVWVDSKVGVGTTFEIYLPRVDAEAPLAREEVPGPPPRGSETVLLVEDEAPLREVIRETLEANGYSVLKAGAGAEALQIAKAHAGPIQIMVTDVIMPGMTGPKTAGLVAEIRPEMKVLFISGYSGESVTRHSVIGPGRAFLSKPFSLEVLLRRIRELLDVG